MFSFGKPSEPPPPPPIDDFLNRNSRQFVGGIMSAYLFGGLLIGLTIHSFPMFRAIALVTAAVISIALAGMTGFPAIQQHLEWQRRNGMQRITPTRMGSQRVLDGSIALTMAVPVLVFLGIVAVGLLIGMM